MWSLPATLPAGLAAPSTAQAHPTREGPDRTARVPSLELSRSHKLAASRAALSRASQSIATRGPGTSNPRRVRSGQALGTLAFLQVLISPSFLFFPAGAAGFSLKPKGKGRRRGP